MSISNQLASDNLLARRYRLDEEIGRGGMGVVYRGHDMLLDRPVAVKLLHGAALGSEGQTRLLREARAVASLDHPNIVTVFDAGRADDGGDAPFIVMQLVPGHSLRERPPRSLDETLAVARQVCAALEYAHTHGIVHRDLKPANILITPDGSAKLMDFGLARSTEPHLTAEGAIVGTISYLAPEQALGREVDARTDLYALGVMLYEMVAGRLPFTADDPMAVIAQHLNNAPAPPTIYNPAIPAALEAVILRLLAKDPADRCASAGELLRALAEAGAQPDRGRHNLPATVTSFVGREREMEAVCRQMQNAGVRLLTLTGPGGTGKTRLALQAATMLANEFDDGVYFVALAPVSDHKLVVSAIAETLRLREAGERPLLEMVKDFLHDKRLLLVLDNFEHVSQAAPLVGELLTVAPGLKVLVTSRVILRLYGEHDMLVPPLELPDLNDLPPLESLSRIDGVRLFVERAQAVRADFALREDNAPPVAEICARLDGLPLAIELAAARVRMLPPAAIAARLTNRLKLLTGGALNLPVRQQTLRATVEWSYDLLAPAERTLFQRIAVFAGGFTLEAAEAVCRVAGESPIDTLEGVSALIDSSLLRPETAAGEPRFSMLETFREYGLERLAASGELAIIRRRHAEFYLALAHEAEPRLAGGQRRAWLDKLRVEIDNFRVALQWASDGDNAALGLRLAGALYWFWHFQGHLSEGRNWLKRAMARADTGEGFDAALRGRSLYFMGDLAWLQGDYAAAAPALEASVAILRALGEKPYLANALLSLGLVTRDWGDPAAARDLLEASVALFRELGDQWWLALALVSLGRTAALLGDPEAARQFLEESVARFAELSDAWGQAHSRANLGLVDLRQGHYERAEALYQEALILFWQVEEKVFVARSLEELAWVACSQARLERAARLFGAAEAVRETIGASMSHAVLAEHDQNLAATRAHLGEAAFAAAWAEGRAMTLEKAVAYALS